MMMVLLVFMMMIMTLQVEKVSEKEKIMVMIMVKTAMVKVMTRGKLLRRVIHLKMRFVSYSVRFISLYAYIPRVSGYIC